MTEVWTDGACHPNPGIGGWGFLMRGEKATVERFGGDEATTNNRMEMTAVLMAMRAMSKGERGVIYSDSQYVVNGMNCWRHGWRRRNWFKKDGTPVLNADLWQQMDAEVERVRCTFKWVRGHNGNPGNERADELAGLGRLEAVGMNRVDG